MESVLVPQVMLYGFLGARPRPGGLALDPRLPKAWPSVSVEGVHAQGQVFGLSAEPDAVTLTCRSGAAAEMALWLPDGRWRLEADGAAAGVEAPTHLFAAGAPPWRLAWEPGQSRRFRRL
jgi:hypothetical protein